MPPAEPLSDGEVDNRFALLKGYRLVVLAVSGGSDSMALLTLAAAWRARCAASAPHLLVATVDHGLRSASRDEAHFVGRAARNLGLEHEILEWTGDKPTAGVQEAAREARYRHLMSLARRRAVAPSAIVTAHTEDDQAETLLMRLARGSGLEGLAAIRPERPLSADPDLALVRPLLGVSKARLLATLTAVGQSWIEDPSNEQLEFERVRLRQARSGLEELGLTGGKLALSARRLARADTAIETMVTEFLAAHAAVNGGLYAGIGLHALLTVSEEIAIRVVQRVLGVYGGAARPAGLSQVEGLMAQIRAEPFTGQTLGGCEVQVNGPLIEVYREEGRFSSPDISLEPGQRGLFDGRFEVEVTPGSHSPGPVTVAPLGRAGYATLRGRLKPGASVPARAATTLPAFYSGGRLIAVPQMAAFLLQDALPDDPGSRACHSRFIGLPG